MKERVAFLGLGRMGAAMAENLLLAGFEVTVWNRSPTAAATLETLGARVAATPAAAVVPGGIVLSMLADDASLEAVAFGTDGFAGPLGPGGLHVAMETIAPATSERLAQWHRRHGNQYVASPVFGRPAAARAAKLYACVSGEPAALRRAEPVLAAVTQRQQAFGADPGAANVVKLAGNFMIASMIEVMAEAYTLVEKHGVPREEVAAFFTSTLFDAPVFHSYSPVIARGGQDDVAFLLRLGLKDLRLILGAAEDATMPMPVASLLRDRLLAAIARGRGERDWTDMARLVREDAGLD